MSAQAGILYFDGRPVDRALLEQIGSGIAQYGPDGGYVYSDGSIGLVYHAFHTTSDSRREYQPYVSSRGSMITWDGRLDNRDELITLLRDDLKSYETDLAIVTAAYEHWASNCFARLSGDWALCVWDPHERCLTLARDYIGVRHLYYYPQPQSVLWSTDLGSLVLAAGTYFHLDDEYIAGYFASYPEPHLTPFREVLSVPPGKFVRIKNGRIGVHTYWALDPKQTIRYARDSEYEEHFRQVFRQAVRRRLRSDSPVQAELSGGLDSSSIVCMADDIVAHGGTEVPRIDTTSRYDPTEPSGDERPYFSKVEERRGRTGVREDVSTRSRSFALTFQNFIAKPGPLEFAMRPGGPDLSDLPQKPEYRVVLSGIGGDEFMGSVPDPGALLADLIIKFHWAELGKQLMAWSLEKKTPWIQLLFRSLVLLLPVTLRAQLTKEAKPERWIDARFARRSKLGLRQLGPRASFGFWLPSRREFQQTVAHMSQQMTSTFTLAGFCQEARYPYLDRDLVEFMAAIPATQILRPGERRSLMRRALAGIVPAEILSRRTKAVTARSPLVAFQADWVGLENVFTNSLSAHLRYINEPAFRDALAAAKNGRVSHLVRILRAISLEVWLRDMKTRGLISLVLPSTGTHQVRWSYCR